MLDVVLIIALVSNLVMLFLTKRDLIQLGNTVDLQTKQLAMLHQLIADKLTKK